jgi:hypothetical protein
MPSFMEDKLKRSARKKGYSGRRAAAYIYGSMNNQGLMHGNKITAKGREADRKHKRDMKAKHRTSRRARRY